MTLAAHYPLGAGVSIAALEQDPHPVLARLREHEPVSWIPALDGWLVTRYDLCTAALRDAGTFTVDDPRFSTAQVIGTSMLSVDGGEHTRHRAPFVRPFQPAAVRDHYAPAVEAHAQRLAQQLRPRATAELRREFAGPLSVAVMAEALGLPDTAPHTVLGWYDRIVASVTAITAGAAPDEQAQQAMAQLRRAVQACLHTDAGSSLLADAAGSLTVPETVSNAAVLLFGGIETTEGMIANALMHLFGAPESLAAVRADTSLVPQVIEESLRLEPAAALVDRYATADTEFGGAAIRAGDLVRVSLAGANRDPAVFARPDTFDPRRENLRRQLAFAIGPHFCIGRDLARLEAQIALATLLREFPRLHPEEVSTATGLVFRKPASVRATWAA